MSVYAFEDSVLILLELASSKIDPAVLLEEIGLDSAFISQGLLVIPEGNVFPEPIATLIAAKLAMPELESDVYIRKDGASFSREVMEEIYSSHLSPYLSEGIDLQDFEKLEIFHSDRSFLEQAKNFLSDLSVVEVWFDLEGAERRFRYVLTPKPETDLARFARVQANLSATKFGWIPKDTSMLLSMNLADEFRMGQGEAVIKEILSYPWSTPEHAFLEAEVERTIQLQSGPFVYAMYRDRIGRAAALVFVESAGGEELLETWMDYQQIVMLRRAATDEGVFSVAGELALDQLPVAAFDAVLGRQDSWIEIEEMSSQSRSTYLFRFSSLPNGHWGDVTVSSLDAGVVVLAGRDSLMDLGTLHSGGSPIEADKDLFSNFRSEHSPWLVFHLDSAAGDDLRELQSMLPTLGALSFAQPYFSNTVEGFEAPPTKGPVMEVTVVGWIEEGRLFFDVVMDGSP